jgi:hypothetical protein
MKEKDYTRNMLTKIRSLVSENKKELSKDYLFEKTDDELNLIVSDSDTDDDNDNDYVNITGDEQLEEERSFQQTVDKLCKFNKIKVYKDNVVWSGFLIREDIEWVFSLDENNGCYFKTNKFIKLEDQNLKVLQKLKAYYLIWSDNWSGRLTKVNY